MLTYATVQAARNSEVGAQSPPVQVLIVSDWIENLPRLRSFLHLAHQTISYAQNVAELTPLGQNFYDFVIVDVGPEYIAYALRELRTSVQLQDTAVFVRTERFSQTFESTSIYAKALNVPELNAERTAKDFLTTSVFTKYRAMAGPDRDLLKLLLQRTQTASKPPARKTTLLCEEKNLP